MKSYRLPKLLILGAQRSGTTSLFNYLIPHPRIKGSRRKKLHYFNGPFAHWDVNWYMRQFPEHEEADVGLEATPFYLWKKGAADFAHTVLPQETKFIALLRNPVERFWSHFSRRKDGYNLSIDFDNYETYRFLFEIGLYAEQLERWFKYWPRENFFIQESREFFNCPPAVTEKICEFVGLPMCRSARYTVHDPLRKSNASYPPMSSGVKSILQEKYAEPNKRLFDLLGVEWRHWL